MAKPEKPAPVKDDEGRVMICPVCGDRAVSLTHTAGLPDVEFIETASCADGHEWNPRER